MNKNWLSWLLANYPVQLSQSYLWGPSNNAKNNGPILELFLKKHIRNGFFMGEYLLKMKLSDLVKGIFGFPKGSMVATFDILPIQEGSVASIGSKLTRARDKPLLTPPADIQSSLASAWWFLTSGTPPLVKGSLSSDPLAVQTKSLFSLLPPPASCVCQCRAVWLRPALFSLQRWFPQPRPSSLDPVSIYQIFNISLNIFYMK